MIYHVKKLHLTVLLLVAYALGSATPAITTALRPTPKPALAMLQPPAAGLVYVANSEGCARKEDFVYCRIINSFGFRGAEPIDDARCRVVVVGSSYVFGDGVGDSQTWAALLESDDVQPFNLGLDAGTLYDIADIAQRAKGILHYDVLVIGIRPAGTGEEIAPGKVDLSNTAALRTDLARFTSASVPTLVAVLPAGLVLYNGQFDKLEALRPIAEDLGMAFMVPRVTQQDVFPHDGHYTVAGNRKVAAAVAPEVNKLCRQVKR